MTTEYSGAGDPRRSVELLWGAKARPRRGPRPRLTVEEIVRTAIAIADAEGLDALSMRRISESLGIAPMSVYTYVPGKAELIDLMLDRAFGELVPSPGGADEPGTAPPGPEDEEEWARGWRDRLERIARDYWHLYHRHPWMLQVATGRPPLGPNVLDEYERELRAVDGLGLTDLEMDSVVALVTGFAESAARVSVNTARVEQRTGMSDAQWWQAAAPVLEKVVDLSRYPLGNRVGTVAGQVHGGAVGPGHAFEFGLQRVLDGIEALVQARRTA